MQNDNREVVNISSILKHKFTFSLICKYEFFFNKYFLNKIIRKRIKYDITNN